MAMSGSNTTATVTLNANMDPSGVLSAIKTMQGAFNNLKLPNNIGEDLNKSFSKATDLLKKYQGQLAKGINTKTDAKNITKTGTQINEVLDEITQHINDLNGQQLFLKADVSGLNQLKTNIDNARTAWRNAIQEFRKNSDIDKVLGQIGANTTRSNLTQGSIGKAKNLFDKGDLEGYQHALDEIYNRVRKLKDTTVKNVVKGLGLEDAGSKTANLELIKKQLEAISKVDFSQDTNVRTKFDAITNSVSQYENELKRAGDAGQLAFNNINVNSAISNTRALVDATDQYTSSVMSAKDQVQDLQRSTQYFFSLRNMINLLKRGIDQAVQSVKDLDKAMTETAVVTDFKVSDMWNMLPEYTKVANELGATTQGAYETMTLYYQQGLEQQQAFEIGTETMKMARIAGLEYKDATDMMTAALRGFNMELNETSAKRINDVYSELAAITASDTEELGSAMQRTASIAASAGASFEGTTAFLAQAIETTREPAENIGTAMKTIIARFQEMKKNPLEVSEVDGEEVDFNKIDAALKTIGVDLVDTNGQFRDFDKVMLDISAKWDTLSQSQQRYIATTAAGSRQQSRFIAMVSNYDRTMQLMEAANNSAGASEEQFGKTVESLEFKLNKLHNAWQRFTMGIANSNFIKGIVDSGTLVLDTVDKILNKLTGFDDTGFSKSLLSIATAFMGLKVGGRAINSLIGGLGGLVDPTSTVREGLQIGFLGNRNNQINNQTDRIVGAINGLIPHIDRDAINNGENTYNKPGDYQSARWNLAKLMGGYGLGFGKNNGKFSINDIQNIFETNGLDKSQQKTFFQSSPGLKHNLTKSLSQMMKAVSMDPEVSNSLIKGFRQGKISLSEILSHEAFNETHLDKINKIAKEQGQKAANEYKAGIIKQLSQKAKDQGITDTRKLGEFIGKGLRQSVISDLVNEEQQLSSFEKMGNTIGRAGAALNQMGISLQMVGSQLSVVNPALGNMVTELGGVITAAGSFVNIIPSLISMGPAAIGIAAAVGGLSIAFLKYKNNIANIKKTAEEVTDSFNKTNKSTQENITNLKAYRKELATLAKGVDVNGNNINLTDNDYETYLKIVDDIASINPSIVKGYNAQGHAIIDNNTALSETLKLQEKIQRETIKQYTSEQSLQKLIEARNIDANYKKGLGVQSTADYTKMHRTFRGDMLASPETLVNAQVAAKVRAPMVQNINNILTQLKSQKGLELENILQDFNITLTDLEKGEAYAVNRFLKNQDAINGAIGNSVIASGEELKESVTKSFDELKEVSAAFDESIESAYQSLQTYASNLPAFKDIAPEFQSSIMAGLKDIVIQPDLDSSQMQEQARILIQGFDNLTAEGSEYAEAMEDVVKEQNKFAESLDADKYVEGTKDALETLNDLMEDYTGKTDAYSQAIAEYLQNQIDKISNFTEESSVSLSDALNEVSNSLTAAEGAYDSFKESTETDFSTGAENMKSIYDEVIKETENVMLHMEKKGDKTMWAGARALLGDNFVEKNAGNVDKIKKAITSLGPELKEGEEGFRAFWRNFKQVSDEGIKGFTWNKDGSYTTDETVNPEVYKQIADEMGRSEQYLTSMLNKGRQYGDIEFINHKDVRKALATDESAITHGKNIFVKKDYLNNALEEAGYVNPNDQKEQRKELKKDNIYTIKDADAIKKEDFKRMGITDLPGLIKTFGDTGQFNRDEIINYAKALDKASENLSFDMEDITGAYDKYIKEQEHPELKPIEDINSTVKQIANLIDADRISKGNFTEEDAEAAEAAYRSAVGYKEGADTQAQYFGEGKDQYGNSLSAKEYKDTYNDLLKGANNFDEKAKLYRKAANNLEKGSDEQKQALEFAERYETAAKVYRANVEEGEKAYIENRAQAAYDKKVEELQGSGLSDDQIKLEAAEARNAAMKKAQEYVAEVKQGITDGIEKDLSEDSNKIDPSNIPRGTTIPGAGFVESSVTNAEIAQSSEIQDKTNRLLRTTIDSNLREALNSLDSTQIAQDPEQTQAFSNLYSDLINNTLPKSKDLETLGILDQINFDQLNGVGEKFKEGTGSLKESVGNITDALNETNTTAMALQAIPKGGKIDKAISAVGEWIKNKFKRINKTEEETPSAKEGIAPTINEGAGKVQQIAQEVVQDTQGKLSVETEGEEKVDTLKTKITETAAEANKGATFSIKTPGANNLSKIAKNAAKASKVGNQSISLKTEASGTDDTKKWVAAVKAADKTDSHAVKLTANASDPKPIWNLVSAVQAFQRLDSLKTVTNKTVNWTVTKKTTEGNSGAIGIRNYGYVPAPPKAGSMARGNYGQVGPKGKGGLTLTGEEGFEIAWLPSENRSMILGANGPQMVNLPGDAVVWTHEQSKNIIKQKSIPLGSLGSGSYDDGSSDVVSKKTIYKTSPKKTTANKSDKNDKKNTDDAKKVIQKAGKINLWWWNMTKKVEATQRRIDNLSKKFEKLLEKGGITLKSISATAGLYRKRLQQQISLNTKMSKRAASRLKTLDKGKDPDSKAVKKARKKLKKAEEKKNKKEIKKAKNELKEAKGYTKVKYDKKVKKNGKTTKESTSAYVNLAKYIKRDKATGAYVVDYDRINKEIGSKSKSKAKAVGEAAKKKIENYQGKKNTADDNVTKAREALDELSKKIYETFFGWETSLTAVYNITKKLETVQSKISRFETLNDLLQSQLETGQLNNKTLADFSQQIVDDFSRNLILKLKNINATVKSIDIYKKTLEKDYSTKDEKEALKEVNSKLKKDKQYDNAKAKRDNAKKNRDDAQKKYNEQEAKVLHLQALLKNPKTNSAQRKQIKEDLKREKSILRKYESNLSKATSSYTSANQKYQNVKKSGGNLTSTEREGFETYRKELNKQVKAINQAQKYINRKKNSDGTYDIEVDYDKIERDRLAGKLKKTDIENIEKYVEKLYEDNDALNEAYASVLQQINDLYNVLSDLQQQWADYGEELTNYLDNQQAEELEKLKKISSSINDSLKDLLDEVKHSLEMRRRQEDNAKTESDISKKQQRLAALRADTSGGNQAEIARLEQELGEAQQSYQRTLEDQLLDDLNYQVDEAAKQRERQIAIQEAILDTVTHRQHVEEVNRIMESAKDGTLSDEEYALLASIYKESKNYDEVTKAEQEQIDRDFQTLISGLTTNYQKQQSTLEAITAAEETKKNIETQTEELNKEADVRKGALIGAIDACAGDIVKAAASVGIDKSQISEILTAREALQAGATGASVQDAYGMKTKDVREEVNDLGLGKKVMGGMTTDNVYNSKGSKSNGQYSKTGEYLAVANGSTLEIFNTNDKAARGKLSSSYTIDKLDSKYLEWYPEIAKEVVLNAIQENKVGTFLNAKMKDLIKASNLAGKEVKINGKTATLSGSIGQNGKIYYNGTKGGVRGVYIWDPSKKDNITFEPYDKDSFLKKAKEYAYVGREYSQVLKAEGMTEEELKNKGAHFKKGGLASFTGPAWLDGTSSKPELVLNAQDTKNFIALKDVLSRTLSSINTSNNNSDYGNVVYDININVEKLTSDYDVDKVAERVKKIIVKDSSYRNVTQVRKFR